MHEMWLNNNDNVILERKKRADNKKEREKWRAGKKENQLSKKKLKDILLKHMHIWMDILIGMH